METDHIKVQFRMYQNKELPKLLGFKNKRQLNRELLKHRAALGNKMGYRWRFIQVLYMLKIFGIPYVVVYGNDQSSNNAA